jgi:DNA-3-methyladenine glycosylase I
MPEPIRCEWAGNDPQMITYHDEEWGLPKHDDQYLFEMLILEGAQAGLSWITILKKRAAYRLAFDNFDPLKVVQYDQIKIDSLLKNAGIVRNKLKINSTVTNAQSFLDVQQEFGSFDKYIWDFVDHETIDNQQPDMQSIPAETPTSTLMSKDLKQRGFRFVGPTICYAFMQSIGMVNDHARDCFRYKELVHQTAG